MAIPPLNGARLSCMLFTEPVVKAVVISVNKADIFVPNLVSFPSMLPIA